VRAGRAGCATGRSSGSEIAHWFVWQKNTTGACVTAAQMKASLTSPWLVAPSPKYATAAAYALGGSRVAGHPVALNAHRVADRVQGLRADDDRVEVEVVLLRVPPAHVDAAEQAEQVQRVTTPAPGDAVFAVRREKTWSFGPIAPTGADLRGPTCPSSEAQCQLALPLQRGGLGVDTAHQGEGRGRGRATRRR